MQVIVKGLGIVNHIFYYNEQKWTFMSLQGEQIIVLTFCIISG